MHCISIIWNVRELTVSHYSRGMDHKTVTCTNALLEERRHLELLLQYTQAESLCLSGLKSHKGWYNQTLDPLDTSAATIEMVNFISPKSITVEIILCQSDTIGLYIIVISMP